MISKKNSFFFANVDSGTLNWSVFFGGLFFKIKINEKTSEKSVVYVGVKAKIGYTEGVSRFVLGL